MGHFYDNIVFAERNALKVAPIIRNIRNRGNARISAIIKPKNSARTASRPTGDCVCVF